MDPYCDLVATCLASPNGLADYRLANITRMLDRFPVDGIYLDDNLPCANCTLGREHGHPRALYECLIELHEMNWRRRELTRHRGAHGVHALPTVITPMIKLAPLCNAHQWSRCARVTFVMKTWQNCTAMHYDTAPTQPGTQQLAVRPSALHLVSAHEMKELREALARGALPPDFQAKLARLAEGTLTHRFLARNCHLFTALLLAAQDGSFKEASRTDCERLLRLLAYVRKDDDAIPDYKPGGFMDDQEEVRAAILELDPLLKSFKAWRLCHQVPRMWLRN